MVNWYAEKCLPSVFCSGNLRAPRVQVTKMKNKTGNYMYNFLDKALYRGSLHLVFNLIGKPWLQGSRWLLQLSQRYPFSDIKIQ